jgi:hypothetical protein
LRQSFIDFSLGWRTAHEKELAAAGRNKYDARRWRKFKRMSGLNQLVDRWSSALSSRHDDGRHQMNRFAPSGIKPVQIIFVEAIMASSSLDPENLIGRKDRSLGSGHGTRALGPSDTSDSGSDLQGAPGMARQVGLGGLGLETGTTSDPEDGTAGNTAGPDLGDANLDSDSDSAGTGERAAASRDAVIADGADINVDHVEIIEAIDAIENLEEVIDETDTGGMDDIGDIEAGREVPRRGTKNSRPEERR